MPRVSVIIPYYNREKTIIRALESVSNQTYKDYEIILIDDGSEDNSFKFVENFRNKNIKTPIINLKQKNQGPSAARNNGIRRANGELIAFLDSDDTWEKEKLSIQIDFMDKNPELVITATNYNIITNVIRVKYKLQPSCVEASFYKMLFKVFFCMPTIIIRREIFEKENLWFREGKDQGEDLLLFLQIIRRHRGKRISIPLTNIYKEEYGRKGGLTSDLKKLLVNDIDNLKILYQENKSNHKKISFLLYKSLILYTYLKHVKRMWKTRKIK